MSSDYELAAGWDTSSGRRRGDEGDRALTQLRRIASGPDGVDEAKLLQQRGPEGGVLLRSTSSPTVRRSCCWNLDPNSACQNCFERRPDDPRRTMYMRTRLLPKTLDALGCLGTTCTCSSSPHGRAAPFVEGLALPSVTVPERAVDAQSLIAFSDLVGSSGGTMNREAVALGVPVYTTFGGRLGGVDEALIREGRLAPLTDPRRSRSRNATEIYLESGGIRGSCSTCCSRPVRTSLVKDTFEGRGS